MAVPTTTSGDTELAQMSRPTNSTKVLPSLSQVLHLASTGLTLPSPAGHSLSPASPPQASLEPSCSPKLIHFFLHHDKVSLQPKKTNLVPWQTPGLQNLVLFEISMKNTKILYLFTTQNIRNNLLILLKCYLGYHTTKD